MENRRICKINELDTIHAVEISTLQVNLGTVCNQSCSHCHLEAGPDRTEIMSSEGIDLILGILERIPFQTLDITGGAPEMHPDFCKLVIGARSLVPRIIDRCNLTVLMLPGQESTAEFLQKHHVEIIASLPCYTSENVDGMRGNGVFDASISALRKLNSIGYGIDPELILNLVYNPEGPRLPATGLVLERDFKSELGKHYGVYFNNLLVITNSPIGRFGKELNKSGLQDEYMDYLAVSFNSNTIPDLMCRHALSVGWDGRLYDCDFNLALNLPVNHGAPNTIIDFDYNELRCRRIVTRDHCLACTAGSGSSCGGELVS